MKSIDERYFDSSIPAKGTKSKNLNFKARVYCSYRRVRLAAQDTLLQKKICEECEMCYHTYAQISRFTV